MGKITKYLIVLTFLTSQFGCGNFLSGSWEDDPDNWQKASSSRKPDDVVVLHSQYIRFAHFTLEYQYFFEIEKNNQIKEQLFTDNALVRVEGKQAENARDNHGGNCPDWFAPKPIELYDVWVYEDPDFSNLVVLIDLDNGNIFIADHLY